MAWYRTGTVTVTNNSKTVTGSGTAWTSFTTFALAGSGFRGPDGVMYEIESVGGPTSLTLVEPYFGASGSGKAYALMPTLGLAGDLAVNASQLLQTTAGMFNGATSLGKALLAIAGAPEARTAIGVDQAIVDMVGGVWTDQAVVVSPSAGALANANATVTHKKVGRTVFFTGVANIITNGSASGGLRITMPFSASKATAFVGRENATTGSMLQGFLGAASNVLFLFRYDNTYPGGDNRSLIFSGVYETNGS
jgi:hypothetical protein